MKEKIRSFLAKHIKGHAIGDDDDIFALRLVSSLFTMQLVLFVEQEFDFEVSGEDLDIANFRSVNAVAALVERSTSSALPAAGAPYFRTRTEP
jgi:acyl carrier protein